MAKISLKKRKLVKKTTSSPTPTETPTASAAAVSSTGLPQSSVTKPEKTIKKKKKKTPIAAQQPKLQQSKSPSPPSSDVEQEPEKIHEILQVCSKDQLIDFAVDAAVSFPSLYSKIREIADKDVSHRKLFVHGLSWEATNETLISEFQKYGEIETSNVVVDRVTGKSKGYGFVTFKTRKSALKALKNPRKEIDNRVVVWQLASTGPASTPGQPQQQQQLDGAVNFGGRKIYVNNVASDVNPDRLREFFSQFGELDSGPTGFDVQTGKFKGYALFVYKSLEGAKKVLEEPYKVFDGRQLHCQKAAEGKKNAGGASGITTAVQPVPPVYAAFAGQNMGFLGQNPGVNLNAGLLSMNPLYSSLLANPNAAMGMANLSSLGGMGMGMGMGMGITPGVGGYGGLLGNALSNVGSRAPSTMMGPYGGSAGGTMLQGLQYAYQKAEDSPSAPASDTSGAATRSSYQW